MKRLISRGKSTGGTISIHSEFNADKYPVCIFHHRIRHANSTASMIIQVIAKGWLSALIPVQALRKLKRKILINS